MNEGRARYYAHFFVPLCADAVLYLLATCGGRYRMCQREVGLRRPPKEDGQGAVWARSRVFFDYPALCAEVAGGRVLCMDFGGIYEYHHLHEQPLFIPPLIGDCNVFMHRPRRFEQKHSGRAGISTGRGEMVIDVDLDCGPGEYNRELICRCGTERKTCDACWVALMRPAHCAMIWALRDFLGLKRIFTVFSGRRGFHIWICDEWILDMTQAERVTFASALARPTMCATPDPFTDGMYTVLAPFFDNHPKLRCRFTGMALDTDAHREAVFDALWPRLDLPVSRDPLHMRKIPLGLHEETGAVCIVMNDPASPDPFLPSRDTLVPALCDPGILRTRLVESASIIASVWKK